MAAVLPDPFYYLENFRHVLAWVSARHDDLLESRERALIATFQDLPSAAQALLVRMVMRKGELFRHGKLVYPEIGDIAAAAAPLVAAGLVDNAPHLTLDELFGVLRKDEVQAAFRDQLDPRRLKTARKEELLAALKEHFDEHAGDAQPLHAWHPALDDTVYRLQHADIYDTLRLLFFGNLHQDWSEFVLTDLGLLTYETVPLPADSRAFQQRQDVNDYRHLHDCRTRLDEGEDPRTVRTDIPESPYVNEWMEQRRARLLFHIGQALEREKDWPAALAAYRDSSWPDARLRVVRVLEQDNNTDAAHAAAMAILQADPREDEQQQLARMLPRLRRKLGLEKPTPEPLLAPERFDFTLEQDDDTSVEWALQMHLQNDSAPVFYVENALINSLFGLLCWPAIFAPVPGAFFHAYHYGPVDLHHPDFLARREQVFAECLGKLESGHYRDTILHTWQHKHGIQSPFVFWDVLDDDLLTLALDCIPPAHLRALFTRLLADIKNNRSGFPDLIRFWPQEQRYQMLEVKGPGDRLQDNQIRWMDYCLRHCIPVAVAHVRWQDDTA